MNRMQTTALGLVLAALAAAAPSYAAAQSTGAHEHGAAELNVAIDGNTVEMELIAAGADIVGFEYAPESDADKQAVANALEALKKPEIVVALAKPAGCTIEEAEVSETLSDGHDDHDDHDHDDDHKHADDDDHADHKDDDHDDHADHKDDDHDDHADHKDDDHDDHGHKDEHDDEEGEAHGSFHAHYHFTCTDAAALSGIELTAFKTFPTLERVRAAVLGASGQTAKVLTPDDAGIEF